MAEGETPAPAPAAPAPPLVPPVSHGQAAGGAGHGVPADFGEADPNVEVTSARSMNKVNFDEAEGNSPLRRRTALSRSASMSLSSPCAFATLRRVNSTPLASPKAPSSPYTIGVLLVEPVAPSLSERLAPWTDKTHDVRALRFKQSVRPDQGTLPWPFHRTQLEENTGVVYGNLGRNSWYNLASPGNASAKKKWVHQDRLAEPFVRSQSYANLAPGRGGQSYTMRAWRDSALFASLNAGNLAGGKRRPDAPH
eukprot:TRINITY_DN57_c0_g4_i2.p1 TRINITY_DN57_c0_g4~~TRINITY_DN57_c0_g4_i2.p1  ORF type:complete len:264 (-),score=37.84 TRINITY_DN57_c0_g4_i2:5-760(-)